MSMLFPVIYQEETEELMEGYRIEGPGIFFTFEKDKDRAHVLATLFEAAYNAGVKSGRKEK